MNHSTPVTALLSVIQWLIAKLFEGQPPAVKLQISVSHLPAGQSVTIKQGEDHLMITLRDDFKLPLTVSGLTAKGHPAPVEGVTYVSSDTSIATVSPTGLVEPAANLGTCQITVRADAQIGLGEKPLLGVVDVEVVAGEAVNLVIGGTPVPA